MEKSVEFPKRYRSWMSLLHGTALLVVLFGCENRNAAHDAVGAVPSALGVNAERVHLGRMGEMKSAIDSQAESLRRAGYSEKAVEAASERMNALADAIVDAGGKGQTIFEYAGLSRTDVEAYLGKIKRAFVSPDRRELAGMIDYPFNVRNSIQGKQLVVNDIEGFVQHWDEIVTPQVKAIVASAELGNLGASWQGVKIGPGTVWFGGKCLTDASLCERQKIRVLAINQPRGK